MISQEVHGKAGSEGTLSPAQPKHGMAWKCCDCPRGLAEPAAWALYLAKDLQTFLLLVTGGQQSELLQQQWGGRGGDVQVVLEGLEDGAGWDTVLVCPVTDDTCQEAIQHKPGIS